MKTTNKPDNPYKFKLWFDEQVRARMDSNRDRTNCAHTWLGCANEVDRLISSGEIEVPAEVLAPAHTPAPAASPRWQVLAVRIVATKTATGYDISYTGNGKHGSLDDLLAEGWEPPAATFDTFGNFALIMLRRREN